MQMSGEVARWKRIGRQKLEPGDVLFFGDGPRSKPAQIDHTGIYLGDGKFINATTHETPAVRIDNLDDPYWMPLLVAMRRVK